MVALEQSRIAYQACIDAHAVDLASCEPARLRFESDLASVHALRGPGMVGVVHTVNPTTQLRLACEVFSFDAIDTPGDF